MRWPLIGNPKVGAVFGPGAAPVVEPGGRDVGVAQPFLDLAQVGAPVQGVGGGRGPQGMEDRSLGNQARPPWRVGAAPGGKWPPA